MHYFEQNVITDPDRRHNFEIDDDSTFYDCPYDYGSVMQYGPRVKRSNIKKMLLLIFKIALIHKID